MKYQKVKYSCINCTFCLKEFEPNRIDKKFCSSYCYKRYGKKFLGHSIGSQKEANKKRDSKRRPYQQYKKLYCESCNFIPTHPCQLDVDHIDGDHSNNEIDNLQTLCANCHRLKTAKQLGWI